MNKNHFKMNKASTLNVAKALSLISYNACFTALGGV